MTPEVRSLSLEVTGYDLVQPATASVTVPPPAPRAPLPQPQLELEMTPGTRLFDLRAFDADGVETHRTVVQVTVPRTTLTVLLLLRPL
jgi:hypothetical protein